MSNFSKLPIKQYLTRLETVLMIGFVILLGVIANLILGVLLLQWGKFKENESLSFYLDEKIGAPMAGGMLFLITVSKIAKFCESTSSRVSSRRKLIRPSNLGRVHVKHPRQDQQSNHNLLNAHRLRVRWFHRRGFLEDSPSPR